jgi:hypothetical protein
MSDRTLVLHIGHHKTGTTYLQKRVFPHMLGLHYFVKTSTPAPEAIIRAFACSPDIWRKQGRTLLDQLEKEIRSSNTAWTALISSEQMSAHKIFAPKASRRDPFLLAVHLKELRQSAEACGIAVKVILGVRRQDQYFASRFASIGKRVGAVSQANFDRQMSDILDPSRRYFTDGIWLDYKLSRDLICEALGEANCLLLPQELLAADQAAYLRSLRSFMGESILAESVPQSGTRENVRGDTVDTWMLRQGMARIVACKCLNAVGIKSEPKRLRLAEELKDRILSVYRDSNRNLARDLNIDLGRYGFY